MDGLSEGRVPCRAVDEHLLVLDKPAGLLSVPGRGEDKQDCLSARVAGAVCRTRWSCTGWTWPPPA